MSVITKIPDPNVWIEICKEFESRKKLCDGQPLPVEVDYDASKHTPVFFGPLHKRIPIDAKEDEDFDASISHPACIGYAFVERPQNLPPPEQPTPPDRRRCSPREYLEHYVFPLLLPALEELLRRAKTERCFERKRTKFNAGDFLTEYLYRNNPQHQDRSEVALEDIPFVQEWWREHPRSPLAKSLLWTEKEAALVIQSFLRGYKVREEEAVQELRLWQKECREENQNIHEAVNKFWADKIPSPRESVVDALESGHSNQHVIVSTADADGDPFPSHTPTTGITKDTCDDLASLALLV